MIRRKGQSWQKCVMKMQKKSESDYKIARQGNVRVITKMQGKERGNWFIEQPSPRANLVIHNCTLFKIMKCSRKWKFLRQYISVNQSFCSFAKSWLFVKASQRRSFKHILSKAVMLRKLHKIAIFWYWISNFTALHANHFVNDV